MYCHVNIIVSWMNNQINWNPITTFNISLGTRSALLSRKTSFLPCSATMRPTRGALLDLGSLEATEKYNKTHQGWLCSQVHSWSRVAYIKWSGTFLDKRGWNSLNWIPGLNYLASRTWRMRSDSPITSSKSLNPAEFSSSISSRSGSFPPPSNRKSSRRWEFVLV